MYTHVHSYVPFTKLIEDYGDQFDHEIDYLGVSTRAIRVGLNTNKNQ